VTPHEQVR